jgi:membrane protein
MLLAAFRESISDHMSLAAAGCGFYATLALFPGISIFISAYGLVFNAKDVAAQLQLLGEFLPPPAFALIEGRVQELVGQFYNHLNIGLVGGLVLAFWSASSGSKSMLSAVNVAYDVAEQRPMWKFQLVGLGMTLAAVAVATLAIASMVVLPSAFALLGLSDHAAGLIRAASVLMVLGLFAVTVALLYRFGPSRHPPPHQPVLAGVAVATVLWTIACGLLSLYVSRIGSFGATYGPLGAAVGIMLWFYVSAYAVLLGAELNAQVEARRGSGRRDAGTRNE